MCSPKVQEGLEKLHFMPVHDHLYDFSRPIVPVNLFRENLIHPCVICSNNELLDKNNFLCVA